METIVIVAVVIVLAAIAIPSFSKFFTNATRVHCMSNMRSLHGCFASYVNDVGYWPQQPDSIKPSSEQYEDWWLATMRPYTGTDKIWICPALKKADAKGMNNQTLKLHYAPTRFDANKITPYRWPTQPWLIEIGDAHGTGALIMFPDGSIKSLQEILPSG